jgi:hypothetical protein
MSKVGALEEPPPAAGADGVGVGVGCDAVGVGVDVGCGLPPGAPGVHPARVNATRAATVTRSVRRLLRRETVGMV